MPTLAPRAARLRRFTALFGVVLPCVVGLACFAGVARLAAAQGAELSPAAQVNRVLEHQVALASGKDFYLVLEPALSTLTLYLKGAALQQYRVEGLDVGRRRWAFFSSSAVGEWSGVIWRAGALEPERHVPRVEIKPGVEASVPPPLPEEQIAVPPAYRIRFADGLVIDVKALATGGGTTGWGSWLSGAVARWWDDFRAAVRSSADDRVRLRLTLNREDAESLYRSLPPDTALLLVPPGIDISRTPPTPPAGKSRS